MTVEEEVVGVVEVVVFAVADVGFTTSSSIDVRVMAPLVQIHVMRYGGSKFIISNVKPSSRLGQQHAFAFPSPLVSYLVPPACSDQIECNVELHKRNNCKRMNSRASGAKTKTRRRVLESRGIILRFHVQKRR